MPLQNFIDNSLPTIKAAWLNGIDVLWTTIFGNATTVAQARTALGVSATGADTTYNVKTANLSDVANAATARNNLGAAASGANTDITSLASPALAAATATTQAGTDSTTKVATTAMVQAAFSANTATQANQETATSTATFVTPGRQQFHPSAPKAWLRMTCSGGTPSIVASYNVTSITDNGPGDFTANFTASFTSSTSYGMSGVSFLSMPNVNAPRAVTPHTFNAGSCRFITDNGAGSPEDNHAYTFIQWFGDLA